MARKDYSSRDHGGTVLTGLAPGVASTDAATVGQLPAASSPAWAVLTAPARSILVTTFTQFTTITISSQSGGFSGASNVAVPVAGMYQINYRVNTSVAGRLIAAVSNTADNTQGGTSAWLFDTRSAGAGDWVGGSKLLAVTTYLQFWAYVSPASSVAMLAEIYRVA